MKDLDLNFSNMPEYLKKIQGIPEENLWKVEEFRKNQLFRANESFFKVGYLRPEKELGDG